MPILPFGHETFEALPEKYRKEAAHHAMLVQARGERASMRRRFAMALRWLAEAIEPAPGRPDCIPERNGT
jgi:Tfp pilus assembly protein PilO